MLEYIRANSSENISLTALAKIAGVSPHHFSMLFTRATGLSPHQYVLMERIERAKRLLGDDTLSIAQVGKLTGFQTHEHFSKVFRKIVGVSPSEFREAGRRSEL